MEEGQFIKYLAQKDYIAFPSRLTHNEFLFRLEKVLLSRSPIVVSNYFSNCANNIDIVLNTEQLSTFIDITRSTSEKINKENRYITSGDDEKVIAFLVSTQSTKLEDFLELSGQLFFLSEVVSEIENRKSAIPEILLAPVLLWTFVNLYELIAFSVDRKLFWYLTEQNGKLKFKDKTKQFMGQINRGNGEHATVGLINHVLEEVLAIPLENRSIFGKGQTSKIFRDKISHSNIFYDSGERKFVVIGGNEYTFSQFLGEFYRIYYFLVRWSEVSLAVPFEEAIPKVRSDLILLLTSLSKDYHRIERGHLKKRFYDYILELSLEAEDVSD